MEIDLLSLLIDSAPSTLESAQTAHHAAEPSLDIELVPAVSVEEGAVLPVQVGPKLPSQIGHVGKGRHGGMYERRLLTSHMRMSKLARKTHSFAEEVRCLLEGSRFISNTGDLIAVRPRSSKSVGGLVLELSKQSRRGNRYKRSITWAEFLEAAYGRFKRNTALAIFLNKGTTTIKNMQVFVCGAWMNQQALLLAKVTSFAAATRPLVVIKHMKFDETSLLCSLNPDKGKHRSRSTWETMVYRLRIVIVWETGENLILPIVLPPVVLLSSGAAHQFYALHFHPCFKCVNDLLKVLQRHAIESFDILEADGASSNERLLAHLYQLARQDARLMSHSRCMSHATQLVNVAVLAGTEIEVMNRLYGLTVFLRNLGYWGRLHQALRKWVAESLVFKQDCLSESDMPGPDPHLQEFLMYLEFWKDLESESSDRDAKAFKVKTARVLELFNGKVSGGLSHTCTHRCVSVGHRHCKDREDAVRKCAESLADLFLSVIPTVPVPSKWTTIFSSLDFSMGGFLVGNWLPHVFKTAFGLLQFEEFAAGEQAMDPRLIEALSFSAVNGTRYRNSMSFLQNNSSAWTISLLTVVMEVSRCLTYYWLGSLKKSLNCQLRCVIFEVLDPSVSVIESLLQHLAELTMSLTGVGRLKLLYWQHASYEDFCLHEPGKVRQLRRLLLLMAGWVYRRQFIYMNSLRYSITVFADPDAHPDVVQRVADEWDNKSSCCMPPGIARMLKLRGLTSHDLQSPRWRLVLAYYAKTLTWSIADVEQQHAVNRQSAACAFSTICAKSINAVALQQKVSEKDKFRQNGSSLEPVDAASSHRSDRIAVVAKRKLKDQRAKGQSAFELFRKDYLRRQQLTGTANPCSRDVWKEVKEAFQQLPQQQRASYDTLALDSATNAAAARARLKQQQTQQRQLEPGTQPMQSSAQDCRALVPVSGLGQPHRNVQQLSFDEFMGQPDLQSAMRKFDKPDARLGSGAAAAKTNYPVGEHTLESVWKCQRQRRITWRDATTKFRLETERIARPCSAAEAFPEHVTYESCCGVQCRMLESDVSAERVNLHVNILAALTQIVQSLGRISQAVKTDLLLACEVFNVAREKQTTFAFVTAMSARSGIHSPEQVYVEAVPVDGLGSCSSGPDRFKSLDLQLCTLPWVHQKKQWLPVQGGDHFGRFRMFSSDEFAKELLDMSLGSGAPPSRVLLSRLSFEDLWPSSVRVLGIDASMQPVLVTPSARVLPAQEPEVGDPGSEPGGAIDEARGDEEDAEIDLMALMVEDAVPQPAAKRKAKRKHMPSPGDDVEVPEGRLDDIFDDPEFQAILGSSETEELRRAFRMCSEAASASTCGPSAAADASDSDESIIEEESELPADTGAAQHRAKGRKRARKDEPDEPMPDEYLNLNDVAVPAAASSGSSSSSSAAGPPTAPLPGAGAGTDRVLRIISNTSWIRAVTCARGLEVCRVEKLTVDPTGAVQSVRVLGVVKRMISTASGAESLQALCRIHKQCMCWLSNSQNLELLLEWLSVAEEDSETDGLSSQSHHQDLAVALKQSLGMRVRSKPKQSQ
ncbi:unnamed protein product [Symbiodinium sp. CCMP2592]|nr:unnamed protein product [Symbiodinium sp. CCMP2592]